MDAALETPESSQPRHGLKRAVRCLALAAGAGIIALAVILAVVPAARWKLWSTFTSLRGRATVEQRLVQYGERARAVWRDEFARVGIAWEGAEVLLVAFKEERRLEVWAFEQQEKRVALLKTYPILAASGAAGPKTTEGDRQVPEGEYKIESLNPNSLYHLALRLNYPNEDDAEAAKSEGRTNLGGDIMIHGSDTSVGCLAMGDPAIEELFVLVADTGLDEVSVLIAPWDLSRRSAPEDEREWVRSRYRSLRFMLYGLRSSRDQPGGKSDD